VRLIPDHVLLSWMLIVSPWLSIHRILLKLRILVLLQLFAVFDGLSRYPLLIESILLRGKEVIVQLVLASRVLGCRSLFVLLWGRFILGAFSAHYLLTASCNLHLVRVGNGLNRFV
jgi:hypothetical protein